MGFLVFYLCFKNNHIGPVWFLGRFISHGRMILWSSLTRRRWRNIMLA